VPSTLEEAIVKTLSGAAPELQEEAIKAFGYTDDNLSAKAGVLISAFNIGEGGRGARKGLILKLGSTEVYFDEASFNEFLKLAFKLGKKIGFESSATLLPKVP
jgi:hypothetical protein